MAQLPSYNAAELKSHGFDMSSFAQMDANNLSDGDMKQIILAGLASEDLSQQAPEQQESPQDKVNEIASAVQSGKIDK